MKKLLFLLLLSIGLFAAALPAQLRTTSKTDKTFYANGQLQSLTTTRTTTRRRPDLFNHYVKVKVTNTLYDSLGTRRQHSVRVLQHANEGRPCRELRLRQTDYDARGKLLRREKTRCDHQRSRVREYRNGKCIRRCIERNPRRA